MKTIDKNEAIRLLEEAVNQRGEDTIVEQCVYSLYGQPGCIVGQVIHNVDPEFFPIVASDFNSSTACYVLKQLPKVSFDEEALDVMQDAQDDQDTGMQWGVVLRRIKARHG